MMAYRQIIHLDLDAFFCAVEEKLDPSLRGVPFAVGGSPEGRGVVSSCSYAARVFGIHSAMPMAQAIRQCPDLVIASSHFKDYRQASHHVMAKLHAITPLVEQISIDEAFLDVTGIEGQAEDIGRGLQQEILTALGLPNSLGIASNKLVAKIATDVGKTRDPKGMPPNAITVVPPGQEAAFLAPLAIRMLWGVGPKTAEKLAEVGVKTIGDLAAIDQVELMRRFGKVGYDLSQRALGIDNHPVITEHKAKSISQEATYARDIATETTLLDTLSRQSRHLSAQLSRQGLTARTVKIKLRWPNFETLTRQITLDHPTDQPDIIFKAARDLFHNVWHRGERVRLLGVGVTGFDASSRQLGLWDPEWRKEEKIQDLLAEVKERYGEEVLRRGMRE